MTPRGKAYVAGSTVALLLLISFAVHAKDKPKDDGCPDGMMRNPAIAQLTALLSQATTPQRRVELAAQLALASQNPCVPINCPDGHHRTAYGACVLNTPDDPDPGFDPYDPGTDIPVTPGVFQDPTQPGDIDDILKPYPDPGNFYQVRKNDIFFGTKLGGANGPNGICYYALRRAAFKAAKLYGDNLSDTAAMAVVNANAALLKHEIKSLRPYLAILGCGWWNDEVSASWKYAAGKASPNPQTGRAISLNPAHAPNLAILRNGGAPARNVNLGTPAQKGTGSPTIANGSWREYPLLWIPEIDLKAFWDSDFNTITAEGVTYDDGSSRAVPPPWVQIRGVDDATGTLAQGTVMGCGPSTRAVG